VIVFLKVKKTTTDLFMKIIVEWTETKISNPTCSDFKYRIDFGFLIKCRIPLD